MTLSLSSLATSAQFTQGGSSVTLSSGVSVNDTGSATLASATVSISGFFVGDVLATEGETSGTIVNSGDTITVSYNSTTGTLTLTGSDTLADYQSVLESVSFDSTSRNPTDFGSDTTRAVIWLINDGTTTSAPATSSVTITPVNQPPTLSSVAPSANYVENAAQLTLASTATVSDPDSLNMASATVSIVGGAFAGDRLAVNGVSGGTIALGVNSVTITYNSSTETLTLTGTDTVAHYQTLLEEVSFRSTSDNPDNYGSDPTRTLTWQINDGAGSNNLSTPVTTILSVTAVNDPPTLSLGSTVASWTEEQAATTLSPSVTISDPDNLDLVSATVSITGGAFTGDSLLAAGQTSGTVISGTNITPTFAGNGLVTFSGSDTLADYQSALELVTFNGGENPTDFGSDPTRTLTWTLNDGGGTANGGSQTTSMTSTVSVTFVNDPPTLSNVATGAHFTQDGGAATLSGGLSVSDPDDLNLSGATISISGGTFSGDGDRLTADGISNGTFNNISVSYNSTTETLTLTGTDTLANYQFLLDHLTFSSSSQNPTDYGSSLDRSITWQVQDPSGTLNGGTDVNSPINTTTVTITPVNQPPTLTNVASSAQYTEAQSGVTLSNGLSVADPDDFDLFSATISISGADIANGTFVGSGVATGDELSVNGYTGTISFTPANTITASYNSATETLTLTGTDSLSHYESALDVITFFSTNDNPTDYGSAPTRTITWEVQDPSGTANGGSDTSSLATTALTITAVNQPPTLSNVATSALFKQNGPPVTLSSAVSVADPDNLDLASATVSITGGTFVGDGDILQAEGTANGTYVQNGNTITIAYDSSTETLTLTGSDTLADYQAVLDSVTFNSTSADPTNSGANDTRTLTWVVNDGGGTANGGSQASAPVTSTINFGGAPYDFNGNGISDLLFQNNDGTPQVWLMHGTTVAAAALLADPGANWQIVAAGDFNHSNAADIVLQNTTDGTPEIWLMNGTTVTGTVALPDPGSSWRVIATGDFNGDGNPDLLLQNSDGTPAIWMMNGTSVVSQATLPNPGLPWHVIATGDFFGNGDDDILFQHSDGTPEIWEMNGTSIVSQVMLQDPGPSWNVIGTGDFFGNGEDDILLQNNVDGTPQIWVMNGTSIVATASLPDPGSSWSAIRTGDFFGNGEDGILLQNVDGTPQIYGMNGTQITSSALLPDPGQDWQLREQALTPLGVPTLSGLTQTASWTKGQPATTLSSAVTITDAVGVNTQLSATVSITGGTFANDGDVLSATTAGTNITASYDSTTQTLTLTGSDSLASYQTVLDSVTFTSGNNNPTDNGSALTRTLTWTVADDLGNDGSPVTTAINVYDPPTLSGLTTASWTENGAPATLSPNASVSDLESPTLASASVALSSTDIANGTFTQSGQVTDDQLSATAFGNITVSYDSTTETLMLTGSDTLADYANVLDSVTFSSSSDNPTNYGSDPTRTVIWTLNDGINSSTPVQSTLSVIAVDNPPTLSLGTTSASWIENGANATLAPSASVSDVDGLTLAGATVQIASGGLSGDRLEVFDSILNQAFTGGVYTGLNVTYEYNSSTQTLTLSGTDTLADYDHVLDNVLFTSDDNPTNFGSDLDRLVTWQVNDGGGTANGGAQLSSLVTTTVSITAINNPPTLALGTTVALFTENQASPTTLSPTVTVTDPDNQKLASATVALRSTDIANGTFTPSGQLTDDHLNATAFGNVTVSYDSTTETLMLTGSDTLADYANVLDSVTFGSSSDNPTNYGSDPTRTVTWTLNDGVASNNLSTVQTLTLSITAVNNPPTLGSVAASANFTQGGASVTLSPNVTASDPDSLVFAGATVSITGGKFVGDGDVLTASTGGDITASYNSSTETLILTGSDTLIDYESKLQSITFDSTSLNPTDYGSNPSRTITWVLNDGGSSNNLSTPVTQTVSITGVNQPPILSGVAATASFEEHGTAVTLSSSATVLDPDNLDLTGATVAITGGTFAGDGDLLAASTAGTSITASYNATTETLVLSGSETLAHYQQVLGTVTYVSSNPNASSSGSNPTRTITWVLNDGGASNNLSPAQTTTVDLTNSSIPEDFSGNGVSGVLWRNTSDGSLVVWLMDGPEVSSGSYVTYQGSTITPDSSWSVAGIGDFNGHGDADILWRQSTSGALVDWSMNGSAIGSAAFLTYQGDAIAPDSSWSLAGIGDLNGDGDADILWRQSTSGALVDWSMNGSGIGSTAYLTYQGNMIAPDSSWSVAGIGDFNGDGDADILWRQSTSGALVDWSMNGSVIEAAAYLTYQVGTITPDASWSVAGIGDFNGDGDADILWRQSATGSLAMWLMNGSQIAASGQITFQGSAVNPDSTWNLVEVGDFNADGKSDLLWQQNTTGTLVEWQMNGTQIVSSQYVTSQGSPIAPSNIWQVQAFPNNVT